MGSTFSGIAIANSGLYVSQRALNTTGHNVSNTDTEGYVRQQVMQVDTTYIKNGKYQAGTGVGIEETRQMRSIFLDNMYRNEKSSLSYWQARQNTVDDIEAVMDDLSDDGGMQNAIDEFFNAWEEVSKDPTGGAARASLIEYGNSLVEMFNQVDDQLDQIQENLDSQIEAMVEDINSIAEQVAELNGKIARCEANGDNANDYKDELNSLLDTLSEYVNINVSIDSNGIYNVSIGGANLVNGTNANKLTCETNHSNGTFNTVVWEDSGTQLKLKDGMLLGLIEARGDVSGGKGSVGNGSPVESGDEEADIDADADSYNFTGDSKNIVSEIRTGLNMMVSLLARKVNEIHSSGEGLDGSTGNDFFVKIDDSLPFEVGNIKVNPELDDTDKIAASSIGGSNDGAIAAEISDFSNTEYFKYDGLKTNISEFYSKLVGWIGTEGNEAKNAVSNQDTLVQQAQARKESLSAVSLDEELSNLVKYQHAYNASARVMSTMDDMIATVIKEMGVVGR
ncbi:MAG: flagellar hook-associated protein FlgK [Bacillota bacterium]